MNAARVSWRVTTNHVLWAVYLSLLAVLLPHTAWAFSRFEPSDAWPITSWLAAIAFEAAIAVFTHKLARHIERGKKGANWWAKFQYRYLNAYSFSLILSLGISSMANLAHAVEFGESVKIFVMWGVPFGFYAVVFGAVLPLLSYFFASVLSNEVETETSEDPAVVQLRLDNADLKKQLRDSKQGEARAQAALDAVGDAFVRSFVSPDKKTRILAAAERWPKLPRATIATITETSGAYVTEVLDAN